MQELAFRTDGHLSVAVNDTWTGEAFEGPVGDRDWPVDAFRHPYAYVARRDRCTGEPLVAASVGSAPAA